mmetsp:Transcript_11580/g.33707  ORF Transcript_11580/g.33707 Transcript_11580/m.33707 type:complete len:296 (+) Transcript_11580:2075-2962(+)
MHDKRGSHAATTGRKPLSRCATHCLPVSLPPQLPNRGALLTPPPPPAYSPLSCGTDPLPTDATLAVCCCCCCCCCCSRCGCGLCCVVMVGVGCTSDPGRLTIGGENPSASMWAWEAPTLLPAARSSRSFSELSAPSLLGDGAEGWLFLSDGVTRVWEPWRSPRVERPRKRVKDRCLVYGFAPEMAASRLSIPCMNASKVSVTLVSRFNALRAMTKVWMASLVRTSLLTFRMPPTNSLTDSMPSPSLSSMWKSCSTSSAGRCSWCSRRRMSPSLRASRNSSWVRWPSLLTSTRLNS